MAEADALEDDTRNLMREVDKASHRLVKEERQVIEKKVKVIEGKVKADRKRKHQEEDDDDDDAEEQGSTCEFWLNGNSSGNLWNILKST